MGKKLLLSLVLVFVLGVVAVGAVGCDYGMTAAGTLKGGGTLTDEYLAGYRATLSVNFTGMSSDNVFARPGTFVLRDEDGFEYVTASLERVWGYDLASTDGYSYLWFEGKEYYLDENDVVTDEYPIFVGVRIATDQLLAALTKWDPSESPQFPIKSLALEPWIGIADSLPYPGSNYYESDLDGRLIFKGTLTLIE